jgi:hypothetical protein
LHIARLFKPLDFAFVALSVGAAVFSLALAAAGGREPSLVVTSPSGEYRYTLDKNITVSIPGVLGDSVVAVENGKARFAESPCENKLCVIHSPLSRAGHWSACLPNQIMLRVEGADDDGEIDIYTH